MSFLMNQSEYYSCDATYRNWLKIELENAEAPHLELSLEEKERAAAAASETLISSMLLLQSELYDGKCLCMPYARLKN